MTPWLDDGDLRLYHGDSLEVLRTLPDESVDCVVTSPPYWGLRDYGTGLWDGGDPDCDHKAPPTGGPNPERYSPGGGEMFRDANDKLYAGTCGKCGATRVDRQMGLEPTPDLFVAGMVKLFREVRRVLASHGTCWVNLGDSYAQGHGGSSTEGRGVNLNVASRADATPKDRPEVDVASWSNRDATPRNVVPGLKPKDLCGIPWRVAFALQQDGWYLRSDIIWSKPNPMPESVTDRPTKAHEYVFLLTKRPRYWFDTEAVREKYLDGPGLNGGAYSPPGQSPHGNARGPDGRNVTRVVGQDGSEQHRDGERWPNPTGRNVRSVWQIATQPYPEAHFATFPEELARRCILAGCPTRVCRVCGKPSERIVERQGSPYDDTRTPGAHTPTSANKLSGPKMQAWLDANPPQTVGWSDCGCLLSERGGSAEGNARDVPRSESKWRPGLVLDPFIGSGTTAKVARDHERHAIGIDLNEQYLELAARRLQQLSLLTEAQP